MAGKLTAIPGRSQWQPWLGFVHINKVTPHRAWLVLGWVTMSGFNSRCRRCISVCGQPPMSTQPGHPFVVRRNEYQQEGGGALRLGSKGGLVHVSIAGKTVQYFCYTLAISGHFRDKGLIIKRYINSSVYLLYRWIYDLSLIHI